MLLLRNTLKAIKNNPDLSSDIIDSFSDNQFKSKDDLIKLLFVNDLIDKNTNVVIFGCWYGSILIENLAPIVNHIYAIDMDDSVIRIGKNELFKHYDNITWSTYDIFERGHRGIYDTANLFINTSCEHMKPMADWKWFPKGSIYAFQSNNMYGIEGHINCVDNIDEFEKQMPKSVIIDTHETYEERGTRFTIIGQIC